MIIEKEDYTITKERAEYLTKMEALGTAQDGVSPMNQEDTEYIALFRRICNRYNINPNQTTRLEYDFVMQVAESESFGNRENNSTHGWDSLTREQKNQLLFFQQRSLLDRFLEKGAITQAQHDKSLHDLEERRARIRFVRKCGARRRSVEESMDVF